jgi:NADH-quinone oxidoreductase subunit G
LRQSDFSAAALPAPWLGMSVERFAELDRILVVGSFLRKDQPLLSQRLRQATKRGALLSIVHATDDDLLMPVANKLIAAPSKWVAALDAIASKNGAAIDPAFDESARGIAKTFESGSAKAILLGAAVVRHPEFAKIFAVAESLAAATGATLGFLTEAANSVGAHIVGAFPTANGINARAMLNEPLRAYLLLGVEPRLDVLDPVGAARALDGAELVVALTAFRSAVDSHATVMLPIAPFTETSGTFVNTEGRAQSFNGTVKPRGDARPAWKVLRVLGNLLNLEGFDYESSEAVRTEITGGATDLSSRCTAHELSSMSLVAARPPVEVAMIPGGLERIADVPIYASDPLVRRSAPLQATRDAATPRARVNGREMASLGLRSGDTVRVAMTGSDEACDLVCQLDERVADGCVAIAVAHPATNCLPAPFGSVRLTRLADVAASSKDAVSA